MGKVSVIIPTYNRAGILSAALDSVLQQGDAVGEIIVIDDGSTDDPDSYLQRYTEKYGVLCMRQERRGPAAARNAGVRNARYDIIAFLDSDDQWKRGKLARQLAFLEEYADFAVSHTWEEWYRRGEYLNQKKIHMPRHGDIFTHCLTLCAVGMSTVVMRKELFETIGGFDESMPCCEDYDLWLRIAAKQQFLLLPERLTIKHGGRSDQLSQQYRVGMDRFRIYSICKILDSGSLDERQRREAIAELARKCGIYSRGCRKHGKIEDSLHYAAIPEKYGWEEKSTLQARSLITADHSKLPRI